MSAIPTSPFEPTSALPGTPEKVEVLAARQEAGLPLYHPRDAQPDPERLGMGHRPDLRVFRLPREMVYAD